MRSCTRINFFTVFENSFATKCCSLVLFVVLNVFLTDRVFGQGAGFGAQAVGGISVDTDGIVKEICVEDGQPVEFGQTIIILK